MWKMKNRSATAGYMDELKTRRLAKNHKREEDEQDVKSSKRNIGLA